MACPPFFCGKRCFARLGDAPPFMRVPFRSGGRGKRCLTGGCLSQAFFRIRFLRAPLRWRKPDVYGFRPEKQGIAGGMAEEAGAASCGAFPGMEDLGGIAATSWIEGMGCPAGGRGGFFEG